MFAKDTLEKEDVEELKSILTKEEFESEMRNWDEEEK